MMLLPEIQLLPYNITINLCKSVNFRGKQNSFCHMVMINYWQIIDFVISYNEAGDFDFKSLHLAMILN